MDTRNFSSELKKNNFVLPDYENSNLSVMRDAIAQKKGEKVGQKLKKIFFMIDGLGYNIIEELLERTDSKLLFEKAKVKKISTTFPSTTTSVLTTLETGLTPLEHGIVGWHTYSKEIGMVVLPYRDSPSLSTEFNLNKAGVPSILPDPFLLIEAAKKGKIMMLYDEHTENRTGKRIQNCELESYATQTDMMIKLKEAIKKGENHFIYVYYPSIDRLEHLYGPSSEIVKTHAASLLKELNKIVIPELVKSDYNLIITSDHGQIEVQKTIKITSSSKIMNYLTGPPWGDSRVLFLNVIPGKEKELENYFGKEYGEDVILVDSETAIKTGIFGKKIVESVRYRFGTHIMIAKRNNVMIYQYPKVSPKIWREDMPGFHSGLAKDEMEIPLIVF